MSYVYRGGVIVSYVCRGRGYSELRLQGGGVIVSYVCRGEGL